MLKALVFLSVIVSLAYSAPYGGYGGAQVQTFSNGGELGFEAGRGLGGVSFGTSAPLTGSSSFIDSSSSIVGVGAPLAQRLEAQPATIVHEAPAMAVSHFESAPALTVSRIEQAPLATHEVVHEVAHEFVPQTLSISRVETPILRSSGGY